MHIILTHEQADFDAIASLLGAHLLDPRAVPLLPRRLNRNVSAFLTLYGIELPFVDPQDLHGESIEAVTLVDTQSLVSIRGMVKNTRVHVIDHHPLREDLPSEWEITISGTGANTTLFVEVLQDRDIPISVVQATLLLLGLYEDTGSLTYSRTRSRDLRAASFLLDQGARLDVAVDFLNHPLSANQQRLYDDLREKAEYHVVKGHTILITCGDASQVFEELSTIAHKLRDLLDPEALIMLVQVKGGVQLIARSTNDQIDVAEIAGLFGGGGHSRAAASLIKNEKVPAVYEQLIEALPSVIHPAITVAEIMSRGPQVLAPDTPVQVAASRMQRYGYEGYPVVQQGRVVGLLTRRAVDRAMSHQLNLTAERLMDAGNYSVKPEDPVEFLQEVMTTSGWGQIPVIHPETEQLIGIVTRTDLLKTLTPGSLQPVRHTLEEKLVASLPPIRMSLLRLIAGEAEQQRSALYIVGGFVRDLLLEQPSLDFDLVVEGDAIQLAKNLAQKYGGRITSHARFGTAKWFLDANGMKLGSAIREHSREPASLEWKSLPATLDLVTARTEFYTHPTALPTIERGSIKLDLHRRDFTINTLAIRLDGRHFGELHDHWGGYTDLHKQRVRVLHSLSFVDDPTRILRAVRFAERFQFQIESRTLELLRQACQMLDRVSGDRLRHELDHIWDEIRWSAIMQRLNDYSVLAAIHPALNWHSKHAARAEMALKLSMDEEWQALLGKIDRRDLMYITWLLDISLQSLDVVLRRLRLSARLSKAIESAARLFAATEKITAGNAIQVVTHLEDQPSLALLGYYSVCQDAEVCAKIYKYITTWRQISPSATGHDLRAMGLPPGPHYREILNKLRDAWLEGKVKSPEEEKALLETLVQRQLNDSRNG